MFTNRIKANHRTWEKYPRFQNSRVLGPLRQGVEVVLFFSFTLLLAICLFPFEKTQINCSSPRHCSTAVSWGRHGNTIVETNTAPNNYGRKKPVRAYTKRSSWLANLGGKRGDAKVAWGSRSPATSSFRRNGSISLGPGLTGFLSLLGLIASAVLLIYVTRFPRAFSPQVRDTSSQRSGNFAFRSNTWKIYSPGNARPWRMSALFFKIFSHCLVNSLRNAVDCQLPQGWSEQRRVTSSSALRIRAPRFSLWLITEQFQKDVYLLHCWTSGMSFWIFYENLDGDPLYRRAEIYQQHENGFLKFLSDNVYKSGNDLFRFSAFWMIVRITINVFSGSARAHVCHSFLSATLSLR